MVWRMVKDTDYLMLQDSFTNNCEFRIGLREYGLDNLDLPLFSNGFFALRDPEKRLHDIILYPSQKSCANYVLSRIEIPFETPDTDLMFSDPSGTQNRCLVSRYMYREICLGPSKFNDLTALAEYAITRFPSIDKEFTRPASDFANQLPPGLVEYPEDNPRIDNLQARVGHAFYHLFMDVVNQRATLPVNESGLHSEEIRHLKKLICPLRQ